MDLPNNCVDGLYFGHEMPDRVAHAKDRRGLEVRRPSGLIVIAVKQEKA